MKQRILRELDKRMRELLHVHDFEHRDLRHRTLLRAIYPIDFGKYSMLKDLSFEIENDRFLQDDDDEKTV